MSLALTATAKLGKNMKLSFSWTYAKGCIEILIQLQATVPDGIVEMTFTTIDGQPAECDSLVLRGPIFGFFGASKEATKDYKEMIPSEELHPSRWEDIDFDAYG